MHKKIILMTASMILIFTWAGAAMAEPQITSRDEFYDVQGTTKEEIRQQMRGRCPGGGGYEGFTQWNSKYNYNTQQGPNGCVGTDISVAMDIVVYLPRWVNAPSKLTPMGRDWANFVKKLALHEEGHRKRAIETAKTMDRKIHEAAQAGGDCRRLGSAINNAADLTAAEGRQKDIQYDQETQHGKTQGVHF